MKVFIGYDPRQPIAFQVCAQSVWEHASQPVEIVRLDLRNLPIKRRGLTEFTYSRFLVPYLSGYEGYSLFLDSDILVRADVFELMKFAEEDPDNVLFHVNHESRKFENASMMLFNNSFFEERLSLEYVNDPANKLFDFRWAYPPTASAGWPFCGTIHLPKEWNHLVGYDPPNPDAKIVHFTMGIPVWKETIHCEFAQEWIDTFKRMNSTVSFQELMGRSVHVPHIAKLAR